MGRRKKTEIVEQVVPMSDEALNAPVEETKNVKTEDVQNNEPITEPVIARQEEIKNPVLKRVKSPSSLVNVRQSPNGEILFRLNNGAKIMVEEEKDGWSKITGYIMTDLVGVL